MSTMVAPAPKARKSKRAFDLEQFVSTNMEDMSAEKMEAVAKIREEILAKAREKANVQR